MIRHAMSEDRDLVAKGLREGFPDPLHALAIHAHRFVFVVDAGEEPGVESHLGEETRVRIRVTERVDVPTDAWDGEVSKLAQEELVANHHVVHHIVVMGACFILHGPASVDELKTTLPDKLAHVIFLLLGLALPPHGEELHLDLSESLLFVSHELHDIGVDDVLDIGVLFILIATSEVLIYGLEPADVVVAVRNNVHVQVLGLGAEVILQLADPLVAVTVQVFVGRHEACFARDSSHEGRLDCC
mmetsp:Transcript_14435/g.19565  ORF Transcript_14435/g.19565 Transcript_14435/m.19565 type:complete len:244 (+) Transcript_14435:354-1085(+)